MNVHTLFIAIVAAVMMLASFWFSQRIDALESKVYHLKQNQQHMQEIVYIQNIVVPEVVKTLIPKAKKEK